MIEEIQKRPFARPLFLWMVGIVLQTCFPLQLMSYFLLAGVLLFLFFSIFLKRKDQNPPFDTRWIWGLLFSCVLVFVSIQVAAVAEVRMYAPKQTSGLQDKAREVQGRMVDKLNELNLADSEKTVLAAITLNYKDAMKRETRRQFSATGLAHLLSVSGFHVGVVCGILSLLFSFLPKQRFFQWIKFFIILFLVWCFTFIAGLTTPAVRAALMFSIFAIGQVLNMRPDRYNTLAVAAFFMLVYNPFYLYEIGFQLSFIAVFFILYLQPRFYRCIELRNPLLAVPWGILTVTVAAQVGTVFLCCYYFGEFSTVFLFTNLFMSLLATMLIPLCLLWMIVPSGIPGVELLKQSIEVLTTGFMWLMNRFSQIPGATLSIRIDFFTMCLLYVILGLILGYIRSRKKGMLFAFLLLLLCLLCKQLVFANLLPG